MAARGQMGRRDEVRLSPGSNFKYNARMSIALLPCTVLMLSMGGKPVLGTLAVGLMISYILDALQLRRGAFFGVWGTLGALGVAYALSGLNMSTSGSWPLQALAFFVLMQLAFLLGVWASLQFKWLQLENPSVVLALERLLFACTPFVAATCQAWAVVVALGVHHAAFYLMPIQFLLYWLFSLPTASSFRSERNYGGQISEGSIIMGPLEACLHTLMLLFLPLLLHVGVHHRSLAAVNTICEIGLLFFVPLMFQLVASRKGALWWLANDPRHLHQVRLVNGAVSAVAIALLLEVRVVFYAFHQYIQLPAPWSYLLVTAASLAALASAGYCLLGPVRRSHLTALLVAAGVSSGLVLGMPLKLLPAPTASAVLLAYYATGAGLLCYLGFVAATAVCMAWFTAHHFWSLNVWIGGAPLKSVCTLIISSAILAISVPGLGTVTGHLRHLADVALSVHSLLVVNLETRLFNFTSLYYFGMEEDVVYPSYVVAATTAVGLIVTRKMKAQSRISTLGSWFVFCCYTCKLSMLLLPSKGVQWASCLLLLATSAPVLLYSERMKPWRGVAHSLVSFLVVASCNHALSEVILRWSGQHPSVSLLLGAVIFVSGLASAPIVVYHFNHVQSARRALSLVLVAGTLFMLLQPPLPWGGGQQQWPINDEGFYDKGSTPRWSTWLLLLSTLASLAAFTSVLPVQHFVRLRLAYAVTLGTSLGVYVCVQYLSGGGVFAVQALVVAALACASVLIVFLLLPSASSPRFVPWLFGLVVALLPVMYMLEGQQQLEQQEEEAEERLLLSALAVRGGRSVLLGLYAALFMLIALVVKLQLASSVSSDSSSKQQQYRRARQVSGLGVRRKPATGNGAWTPAVGNAATLCCFLLCMVLNQQVAGGSHRAVLLLAPILLLLNQDSSMLPGFGDRQRYFPLTAVISVYLVLIAVGRIWEEAWHEPGLGAIHTAKNTLLLLLTLANHAMFNAFMWSHSLSPASQLHLWTSPLCLPALVATDVSAVRALALLAILYALVQHLVYRHVRMAGLKYI